MRRMMEKKKIRRPFFVVNPKAYIYGEESVRLAKYADRLAEESDVDVFFTGQLIDLPSVKRETGHVIVTAQHMDGLVPGRGMGHVLPEALAGAGVEAVCEPTSLIGTGKVSGGGYMEATRRAVKEVSPDTLVLQAAGISTGDDVYQAIMSGADGTGATSGIVAAADPYQAMKEMIEALAKARDELKGEEN